MADYGWSRDPTRKRPRFPKPPGAPPGTLMAHPDSPPPVIQVLAYGEDRWEEHEIRDPEELREYIGRWPVTWVNVDGLGGVDLLTKLGRVFGLHPLAMEDALHPRQRPKIEEYEGYTFIVGRMPAAAVGIATEQLALFLGDSFVITLQDEPGDYLDPVRSRIRDGRGQIRGLRADYLAYAIIDAVVDSYFPVLEDYGERLQRLEEEVLDVPSTRTLRDIHDARHDLLALRRAIWPQREVLSSIIREPTPRFTEGTRLYMRDCYDHAVGIMDLIETYRELGASLTDLYMSALSNRMNEIMKVLTVIATIFIPLTFVAGIYGMNFDREVSPWNMPELEWYWGYPFALVVMLAIALSLILYFRKKRWV